MLSFAERKMAVKCLSEKWELAPADTHEVLRHESRQPSGHECPFPLIHAVLEHPRTHGPNTLRINDMGVVEVAPKPFPIKRQST